jgi:hypothetical protein
MSKRKKKQRRKLRKLEERSDQRTAEFVAGRLEEIQTDLGDLIPDLQTFTHYPGIIQVSFCIRMLECLRKKYQKRAEGQTFDEDDW